MHGQIGQVTQKNAVAECLLPNQQEKEMEY